MIILEILKIIGFVLAGIVGLVILLLLLVLLVPLRYQLKSNGENADVTVHAKVSMIFGAVSACVLYQEKKLTYAIKAVGIPIKKGELGGKEAKDAAEVLQEEFVEKEQAPEVDAENQSSVAGESQTQSEASASEEKQLSQEIEEKLNAEDCQNDVLETQASEEGNKNTSDVPQSETMKSDVKSAEPDKAEEASENQEKAENIKTEEAEENTEEETKEKVPFKEKFRSIVQKVKDLYQKYQSFKRIWEAKTTKRALKFTKIRLLKLLNHIKPRKIAGTVTFGLEDPSKTAILFGNIGALAEWISDGKLIVAPDFYQKIIQMNILIKGRIFLGYVVLCGLRLYFNVDNQRVLRAVRRNLNGK